MRWAVAVAAACVLGALTACSGGSGAASPTVTVTVSSSPSSPSSAGPSDSASGSGAGQTAGNGRQESAAPGSGSVGPTAAPPSNRGGVATTKIVLRPVDLDGNVVSPFRVTDESSGQVDCSYPEASPSAVDPDIVSCSPSAESATACFRSKKATEVLCLRDPFTPVVTRIPSSGAPPKVSAPHSPVPIGLLLDNGVECTVRSGGASGSPSAHPTWVSFYYCTSKTAVWAAQDSGGIDTSQALWTVQAGPDSGSGSLQTVAVLRAFYVGSAD